MAGLTEVRWASGIEGLSMTELPIDTSLGSVLTIFPVIVRLKPLGGPLVTLDVPKIILLVTDPVTDPDIVFTSHLFGW
jgi:hypothetical protein